MGVQDTKTLAQMDCRVCSQLHTTEIPFRREQVGLTEGRDRYSCRKMLRREL